MLKKLLINKMNSCEFCNSVFKTKYTLKSHLNNNKTCLKSRGLVMDSTNQCKGCSIVLTHKTHLDMHQEVCKEYIKYNYEQIITQLRSEIAEKTESNSKYKIDLFLKEQTISFQEKMIADLQTKNKEHFDKIQESYEKLAKEAINRPSTVNHIRNNLSLTYTLDSIKEEDLMDLFRENLTETVFMNGQKALAKLCTDKIINKDSKKLICCFLCF